MAVSMAVVISACNLHWSEPSQSVCAVLGNLDHYGFHPLSPHH